MISIILQKKIWPKWTIKIDENDIDNFPKKDLFGSNGPFWVQKWHIS